MQLLLFLFSEILNQSCPRSVWYSIVRRVQHGMESPNAARATSKMVGSSTGSGADTGVTMCAVCLDALRDHTAFSCAHVFCFGCAQKVMQQPGVSRCPLCRRDVEWALERLSGPDLER